MLILSWKYRIYICYCKIGLLIKSHANQFIQHLTCPNLYCSPCTEFQKLLMAGDGAVLFHTQRLHLLEQVLGVKLYPRTKLEIHSQDTVGASRGLSPGLSFHYQLRGMAMHPGHLIQNIQKNFNPNLEWEYLAYHPLNV